LKRISLVVLAMAALAVVAPATALGRDAPADREPGGPTARASWAIVVPAIGLAVRLAAGPASRAGAGIVAGIIGRRAPQVGKVRTSRAIKDARTVTRRKVRDGFYRTRRWLRRKWPSMKFYSAFCLAGAAEENENILVDIAVGELPTFESNLRRTAARCGLYMAGAAAGKLVMSNKTK
jgi:hypothetical protein